MQTADMRWYVLYLLKWDLRRGSYSLSEAQVHISALSAY